MKIPEVLTQIANRIDKEGGVPILVGGAVRDFILNIDNKDLDVEVFGLYYNQLIAILKRFGKVSAVGKAFGVLKLSIGGIHYDFSLPRNDLKTGLGHKGFRIKTNPTMSFHEAALRRDFTINAMGYNLITNEILDEFGGKSDLRNRLLRVVDPGTFAEDPLRVLRGIQFAARFKLSVPKDTKHVLTELTDNLEELPRERIFKELKKLLLKANKPSVGLRLAEEIGVTKKLFPELNALHQLPRSKNWPSEDNAWSHTLKVLDETAKQRTGDKYIDMSIMLAALCHEFVKLNPEEFVSEKLTCGINNKSKVSVTKGFLCRLTNESRLIESVDALVHEHITLLHLHRTKQGKNGDIRRLSLKVNIPMLVKVARADYMARFNKGEQPDIFPAGSWLMERYHRLKLGTNNNLQPLLLGRHLIELGLKPGPFFGKILNNAYQKQLDDEFITLDDALSWAKDEINHTKQEVR